MKVQTVCVLGGTGFVGRALVSRLANSGCKVRVLTRHPQRRCREVEVVPNVTLLATGDTPLAEHFKGCDAVINLVGILNEAGSQTFRGVHVELAKRVAAACVEAGVPRLLHMSALNADAVNGVSDYLKTKGEGEDAVHATAGLKVTSFRPSVIFGCEDSFFNRFAGLLKLAPVLPLACPESRFQPVYVRDVAAAFAQALEDERTVGKRLELGGPRIYTLKELVEFTARTLGLSTLVIGLPDSVAKLQAKLMDKLPTRPFSLDNYRSLQQDSIVGGEDGFALLGIVPRSVEGVMPRELRARDHRGPYAAYRASAGR
ncbi:MAG TPA: complex I NDUFA9 subunit family protein [Plasticicumulans sp.]|nr:complex I NDUFA9 subunit family protein [Plasticicumulans sp.]